MKFLNIWGTITSRLRNEACSKVSTIVQQHQGVKGWEISVKIISKTHTLTPDFTSIPYWLFVQWSWPRAVSTLPISDKNAKLRLTWTHTLRMQCQLTKKNSDFCVSKIQDMDFQSKLPRLEVSRKTTATNIDTAATSNTWNLLIGRRVDFLH
jgi:hypothetical protein